MDLPNGKHGGTKLTPHHAKFHIHKATEKRIKEGRYEEGEITLTDQYADLDHAIQYFINVINLHQEDKDKYFPSPAPPPGVQTALF